MTLSRNQLLKPVRRLINVIKRLKGQQLPSGYVSDITTWLENTEPKHRERLLVHPAHEGETLIRTPPIHLGEHFHEKFACELEKQSPPTFVLEYRDGRCWGTSGTVLTPDNLVLSEMSHEFCPSVEQYNIFRQSYLQEPRRLKGSAVVLAAPAGNVFGHFLFDVLPKLAILEKAGFDWRKCDHFIISGPFSGFQEETFELLGLGDRVVDASRHPHWTADRLLVPSRPGISGNYPSWVIDELRTLLMPLKGPLPEGLGSRILVSRDGAAGRRVENELELFEQVKPLGFTLVRNEQLSIPETIAVYQQAEWVIGPMGSGMCSTLFCDPGTRVVELYPDSSVNVFTWSFGRFLSMEFGYLIGKSKPDPNKNQHDWDYQIDTLQLMDLLNAMCI